MLAIILAGGRGTRLRPLTDSIPKSLIQIDNKNLTEHIFDILKTHQVDEVILSVGYLADKIQEYFGDGSRYGIKLRYLVEEKPMGTAAPLILMKRDGIIPQEDFFMMNGDNLFSLDIASWYRFHTSHNGIATIALYMVDDPSSYGVCELEDQRICRFVEKPPVDKAPSNLINSGYYLLSPKVFDYISQDAEFAMMERDVFPVIAKEGLLYGYRGEGQWFDTGTPERYEQVKREWKGMRKKAD